MQFPHAMRRRACAALALALTLPFAIAAHAQGAEYPNHPITLIVPFAPGGGTDSIARDIAKSLSEKLGQTVVIDNRGGAGGAIGAGMVAKAAPDGYTLLFATSTFVTNAAYETNTPYSVEKDFSPIAMIGRGPLLVVTSKEMNVKTIAQLRDTVKSRKGAAYCSAGNGSINHLSGELFRQKTGLDLTHVPYKGSGPATIDLLAGRVQLFFATVPTILPFVRDNKVDVLAVTSAKRSPQFPNTPTMAEAGMPGFDVSTWWGVMAPAKTPQAIIAKLNAAINEAAASEHVRARLTQEGADPISGPPAEFQRALSSELAMWRNVAKAAGIKAE